MFEHDPYAFSLKAIGNKWKPHILWELRNGESIRFREIFRRLPITERVLSQTLKELVADGLVVRTSYNEVPPRVEYSITELGSTTIPIITALYDWGREQMETRGIAIDDIGEMRHGYIPLDKNKTENPAPYCVDE